MLCQHDIHDLIRRLEQEGVFRVLRKLEVPTGRTGVPYYGGDTSIGIVLDVETTGLDPAEDRVIELAMRRFRYDKSGLILKIDEPFAWFEDPERPLTEEITRLTGLTDAGLAGQRIDEDEATRLLSSAHLVIAHNAAFDRKFVERRLSKAAGRPWACSMREIDWAAAGFDGRNLGWLGMQAGWFHDAHRATGDVDAVIALLSHVLPNGQTALRELIQRSAEPTHLVQAVGADFGTKDELRKRGYRWNPGAGVWWKEVAAEDLSDEQAWLGRNIYCETARPRALGPRISEVTARERYA